MNKVCLLYTSGLEAFGTLLKAELDKTLASIYEAVGYTFNLNSPKQLAEALFDKMGPVSYTHLDVYKRQAYLFS